MAKSSGTYRVKSPSKPIDVLPMLASVIFFIVSLSIPMWQYNEEYFKLTTCKLIIIMVILSFIILEIKHKSVARNNRFCVSRKKESIKRLLRNYKKAVK